MSFFFGGRSSQAQKPQYTGLQVQTSTNSLPVPILFGTNSLAPNLIWYDNFQTITKREKQGGKGGSVTVTSYSYTADVILGLCEGKALGTGRAWIDKSESTIAAEGFTFFDGSDPQAAWPYLVTNYPSKAIPYNGLCYIAQANYPLTDSAGIQNHNIETYGYLRGSLSAIGNNDDADVALCIQTFLTHERYGCFFPPAYVDTYTLLGSNNDPSLQTYCKATGFGISPVLSSQEKASDILERWLDLVNCTVVWSDGLLKFKPYAEQSITGNGFTWTATTAPLYDLTDDDFVAADDEDPIKVTRIDASNTDNIIRIEIADRSNRYSKLPVEVRDESAIHLFGSKVGNTITATELCTTAMASMSGQLMLQRKLYVRNNYKFKLSWEYCLLEPMDVVTVTDTRIGLTERSVRIIEIEEDDDGNLGIVAEDLIVGLGQPTAYPKQGVTNAPINTSMPAPDVNPPMIWEPLSEFTHGASEIWVAASGVGGATTSWGGAEVWVSTDNVNYSQLATIGQRATQGVLTAALATYGGSNPDTANTLRVNLTQSSGSLISVNATDAAAGVTNTVIDGEVLSYELTTLTSAFHYDVTRLYRGQGSSDPAAHSVGAIFTRLDDAVAKIALPDAYIGKQLYVKFVSFNAWGGGKQDISTLTPYTFTPSGVVSSNVLLDNLRTGIPVDLGNISSTSQGRINLGTLPVSGVPINLGTI